MENKRIYNYQSDERRRRAKSTEPKQPERHDAAIAFRSQDNLVRNSALDEITKLENELHMKRKLFEIEHRKGTPEVKTYATNSY